MSILFQTEKKVIAVLILTTLSFLFQNQKKGSFLSRGKASLGKIAEVVQTTHGGHASKNSRNFLFQTVDGPKDEDGKTDQVRLFLLKSRLLYPLLGHDIHM